MLHSVIEVRVGVQDISKAINFYRNVFGFEVLESYTDHALVGVAHSRSEEHTSELQSH